MRYITMKELNAFDNAITRVREVCAKFGPMSRAVPEIMAANDPSEALSFGIRSIKAIAAERDEMLRQFERAAHDFFGEGKSPQETLEDFFSRVCNMTQDQILAVLARNGLEIRL